MIAQVLMSVLLAAIALYAAFATSRVRYVGRMVLGLSLGGLYFVWFQDQATRLAHLVGIGRGVDLFIYGWIVFSLLAILNLHLLLRLHDEKVTLLVRRIALLEADRSASGGDVDLGE